MTIYVGLDVHCKKTVYVALNSEGDRVAKGSVATTAEGLTAMLDKIAAPLGTTIALESGTLATWTFRLLKAAGMSPQVIEAVEVRALASRRNQKSDSRDAAELAHGIRRGIYRKIVFVPDEPIEDLRRVLSRRRHFIGRRTGTVNAARFLIRTSGCGLLKFSLISKSGWENMLAHPWLERVREHLEMHFRAWLCDSACIAALDVELGAKLKPFSKELELLTSVPGVGKISAAAFIAAVADPDRFAGAPSVASYLGLVPSTYDSGDRQIRGHITKAGPSYIRAVLCEAAHQAARSSHPLNPYWRKVCVRGSYCKAVVAVAHRLVRIMFAIWRDGNKFDVGKLAVEATSRSEGGSRKVYYRLKKVA